MLIVNHLQSQMRGWVRQGVRGERCSWWVSVYRQIYLPPICPNIQFYSKAVQLSPKMGGAVCIPVNTDVNTHLQRSGKGSSAAGQYLFITSLFKLLPTNRHPALGGARQVDICVLSIPPQNVNICVLNSSSVFPYDSFSSFRIEMWSMKCANWQGLSICLWISDPFQDVPPSWRGLLVPFAVNLPHPTFQGSHRSDTASDLPLWQKFTCMNLFIPIESNHNLSISVTD